MDPGPRPANAARPRDGRATRWDAHREDRRRTIIEAAVELIEAKGPDALTGEIAERAGVPRTHVYRHFADKQDLDRAVVHYAMDQLAHQINLGISTPGSILDIARAAIGEHVRWMVEHPNLNRFMDQHALRGARGGDARTAFSIGLTGLIEAYLRHWKLGPEPAEPLAVGIVGMVESTVAWWIRGGPPGQLDRSDFPCADLIEMLVARIWALLDLAARSVGLELDANAPLPALGPQLVNAGGAAER